jgi:hypothetical protein
MQNGQEAPRCSSTTSSSGVGGVASFPRAADAPGPQEVPHTDDDVAVAAGKDEKLGQAIDESLAEVIERENSDLVEAIVRSKADAPLEFSDDGVIVLRLDRRARAPEVASALLEAPALSSCRARVEQAGCELRPPWANGAWLLVPMTKDLYEESGLHTRSMHILVLSQDEGAVRQALQEKVPNKKRPQLRSVRMGEDLMHTSLATPTEMAGPLGPRDGEEDNCGAKGFGGAQGAETVIPDSDAEPPFELIVDRTFISIKSVRCADAHSCHSAPARLEGNARVE